MDILIVIITIAGVLAAGMVLVHLVALFCTRLSSTMPARRSLSFAFVSSQLSQW